MGVSVGAENYYLRALAEKGQIKACNFCPRKRLSSAYSLTPRWNAQKKPSLRARFWSGRWWSMKL
ncbi:MAG: hypothetical protein ACI9RO_000838 [Alteromonas macleodii]